MRNFKFIRTLIAFAFLIGSCEAWSQQITGYRYWFNDDGANAVEVPVTPATQLQLQAALPAAALAPGFHRITIQFLDEINWGSAIVRVPRELHLAYGDPRSMRRFYPAMVAWMDYQARNWADHDGNIPGLGDWSALDNTTPLQLPIVAGYRSAAAIMAETAQVLGLDGDVQEYRLLAEELAAEFNRRFRHTAEDGTVFYGSNSQASNAMALEAGLVAEEDRAGVLQHLVSAVRSSGNHITTGSVALGPLFRALQDADRDDVILDMVTTPTPPGYGHLVAQACTEAAMPAAVGRICSP